MYQFIQRREQAATDDMMMPALYYTLTWSSICMVLSHWNTTPQVNMSPHSDTVSLFWSNQSLFLLPIAEKQQQQIS